MIGQLRGLLLAKTPPQVLVEVQGVGYEVDVPMSSFYLLPGLGEPVTLRTHFIVREDAQLLFGFLSEAERSSFRQLIRISGVGPKMALALLSGLSVEDLAQAVARQDASRLVKVPGIGKKTAERLLLELKGKIAPALDLPAGSPAASGDGSAEAQADILQALIALGYSEREAQAAVKALPAGSSVADGIRRALRSLAG
ncbi:Holliday junction branch migration protein RuvA [Aquariibacter albus]|uniref:Holliday junction branch migration complex subunit RuvA n=1 Tax=Aquariibacter albus TaxID=2759899 RepID=A0A839HS61_9BURK|nr:Holliday junction branch migration protein RuvA [Aquariibacter albus]MBB1161961.1 Holliday junction branch migration protein RuvA [Aquariibacter albus]